MDTGQLGELSTVLGDLSNALQQQGKLADAFELGRQRLQLLRLRNAAPSLVSAVVVNPCLLYTQRHTTVRSTMCDYKL
jgi:hypothetical protein